MSQGPTVTPPLRAVPGAVPRRRRRHRIIGRRRRRRWMHTSGKWLDLPIGARVYAQVKRAAPEPDRLRRTTWGWCEVISIKQRSPSVILRPDGEANDIRSDSRGCFIRASSGRWMDLRTASIRRHPTLWWWHNTDIQSFRPATELEVAFYSEGFVPHAEWRLMDGAGKDFIELEKPERVWLAKPEPPTDEQIIEAKEKAHTKARASELEHARRMLAMWERDATRATKRMNKWKAAVRRLEKALRARKEAS